MFGAYSTPESQTIHIIAYELLRVPFPRTWLHKSMKKDRSCYAPALLGITLLALLRLARYSHSVDRSLEKGLVIDLCETQANSLSGKPCEVEGQ
jgi:hypothetical protein